MRTLAQRSLFDEIESEGKKVPEAEVPKAVCEGRHDASDRASRKQQGRPEVGSFTLGIQRFILLTKLYADIRRVTGGYVQQPPASTAGENPLCVLARAVRAFLITSGLASEAYWVGDMIWWAAYAAAMTAIWLAARNLTPRHALRRLLPAVHVLVGLCATARPTTPSGAGEVRDE